MVLPQFWVGDCLGRVAGRTIAAWKMSSSLLCRIRLVVLRKLACFLRKTLFRSRLTQRVFLSVGFAALVYVDVPQSVSSTGPR